MTYTSDVRGAGTDATVFVELTGKAGSSPPHSLIAPGSASDSFGRGQTDSFTLQLPELGVLQSLTIGRVCFTLTAGLYFCRNNINPQQGCFATVCHNVCKWSV